MTAPTAGDLTIDVDARDAGAEKPPVEVCCVDGDERIANPITVPVTAGMEIEVKVGMQRGFTTVKSFLVKTAFAPS